MNAKPSKEFLEELSLRARDYGWNGDYNEIADFVDYLYGGKSENVEPLTPQEKAKLRIGWPHTILPEANCDCCGQKKQKVTIYTGYDQMRVCPDCVKGECTHG